MTRLERLMGIALLLSARRRLRAEALAREFGISERTVYRDLRALQASGFPVQGTPGDGYRLPSDAFLRPLAFTEAEAAALSIAASALASSADEGLRETLGSALSKLESGLGPEVRAGVRSRRASVAFPPGTTKAKPKDGPLGEVLEAVRARQVLSFDYDAVTGKRSENRRVEPLGLVRLPDGWLLVAHCLSRQAARAFRLDRMQRLRVGEPFAPRPGGAFAEVIAAEEEKRRRGS
ncbi:MAG TPA: WYL domain-containing protein [Polyangiaceae bacterium]|nr:WYL domain-containing protein [Polyangiaceae bacterium]